MFSKACEVHQSALESIDKSGEDPVVSALRPYGAPDEDGYKTTPDMFQKYFGNYSGNVIARDTTDDVSLLDHFINLEHSYDNETQRISLDDIKDIVNNDTNINDSENVTVVRPNVLEDVVTKFLRLIETQHLLGENCTAGTHLNLGEGVVDRYAQERFRIEADVAVNRANMLTRLWKYAGPSVMHNEYLLHASVFSMVEFDDDVFAAGNCYDQYQYKDYQLFCPFAYRLPEGPILAKDLAVEYKYLSNTSEWFYIARKNAERVIRNHNQFRRGYNTYTYNDTAHTEREFDEILSVTYEDGKWSKPYYDCGGGNIWMLTYTVPFFGYSNGTYFFNESLNPRARTSDGIVGLRQPDVRLNLGSGDDWSYGVWDGDYSARLRGRGVSPCPDDVRSSNHSAKK
ncbi:jg24620 [Pararge aegeria aegeria]|uniref:Jg24620 protein n=1 Tax=Pararge aegeria aegeria TaxID=348720 RepID=A0A8S4QMI9_9NEOP|nr:jg24620 [Pararge aegeria aegeria]